MSIGYGAVQRFGPADGTTWLDFLACSGLPHLVELISLDGLLCPNLVEKLEINDWPHTLADEGALFFFRDLDYFLSRYAVPPEYRVIAIVRNPSKPELLEDPTFDFVGYDLIEKGIAGGISALTNCGVFENAFCAADLNQHGLIDDFELAYETNRLLLLNYREEPHAVCDIYGVWSMIDPQAG